MRLTSYLLSAREILAQYKGDVPFANWLKAYFREHKKFGSKDRRIIADLCFCRFRLGHAFSNQKEDERMLTAQFLCHTKSPFVEEQKPEWESRMHLPLKEKLAFLDQTQSGFLFPAEEELSNEIDREDFQFSFLQQPDLFLRIRPGKEKIVVQKLRDAGLSFINEGHCLRLPNSSKIDDVLLLNEEAVIQDKNSQQVLTLLQRKTPNIKPQTSLWDCCAASGGKTILFYDNYPAARITVSDVRENILINLRNRLKRAGIGGYKAFVADVAAPQFSLPQKFDVILCDAPCSGSGTWARTPEQTVFFSPEKIDHYVLLQRKIAANARKSLKPGGLFLYITCSVFKKENEDVVEFLTQRNNLRVLAQQYFKGYTEKADTLFAALFTTL